MKAPLNATVEYVYQRIIHSIGRDNNYVLRLRTNNERRERSNLLLEAVLAISERFHRR